MVNRMKTTIDLPDALASEARELARRQGASLRELVIAGLRSEVDRRRTSASPKVDFVFPTAAGEGLRPGIDPTRLTELAYDLPS